MKLYLSSYEYDEFSLPKEILTYEPQVINNRNCLVVTLKEPIVGNKYGFNHDLFKFILVDRFDDEHLKRLKGFPIDVHVFVYEEEKKTWEEMKNIAWACLYDNLQEAKEHKI
jgi:hypothetical protein